MSGTIFQFKAAKAGYYHAQKFYMPAGAFSGSAHAQNTATKYDLSTQAFSSAGTLPNGSYNRGGNAFNQYFGVNWKYGGSTVTTSGSDRLNYNNDGWTSTAALALASNYYSAATFSTERYAYVMGGAGGAYSTSVSKVDMASISVSSGTAFSTGRWTAAASNVADFGVMTHGETAASTYTNSTQVLKFSNDTWSAGGNHATSVLGSTASTSSGVIYVSGGYNGSTYATSVYNYDFVTNVWTTTGVGASLATGRRGAWGAGFNGAVYTVGGNQASLPYGTELTSAEILHTPSISFATHTLTATTSANHVGNNTLQTDFGFYDPLMTDFTDYRWLPDGKAIVGGTGTHQEMNLSNMAKANMASSAVPTNEVALYYSGRYGGYIAGGDSGAGGSYATLNTINRYNFINKSNQVHVSALASNARYYGFIGGDPVDNVYYIGGTASGSVLSTTDMTNSDFSVKSTPTVLSSASAWGATLSFSNRLVLMFGNGTSITTNNNGKFSYYFANGATEASTMTASRVYARATNNAVRGIVIDTMNSSTPITGTRHIMATNNVEESGPSLSASAAYSVASAGSKAHLVFGNTHHWLNYSDNAVAATSSAAVRSAPGFNGSVAAGIPLIVSHPSHLSTYQYNSKSHPSALAGGYGLILGGAVSTESSSATWLVKGNRYDFASRKLQQSQMASHTAYGASANSETVGVTIGGYTLNATTGTNAVRLYEFASETTQHLTNNSVASNVKFNAGWGNNVLVGTVGGASGTGTLVSTHSTAAVSNMAWTAWTFTSLVGAVAAANRTHLFTMGGGTTYSSSTIGSLTTTLYAQNLSSGSSTTSTYTGANRTFSTVFSNGHMMIQVSGVNTTNVLKLYYSGNQVACTSLGSYWDSKASFNNSATGIAAGGNTAGTAVNTVHSYSMAGDAITAESSAVLPYATVGAQGLSSAPAWLSVEPGILYTKPTLYKDQGSSLLLPTNSYDLPTETNVSKSISGRVMTVSENSSNAVHQFSYQGFRPAGQLLTAQPVFEITAKSLNGRKVMLHFDAAATAQVARFTLSSSGTVDTSTGVSASITQMPNGYYRIRITSSNTLSSGTNDWRPWVSLYNSATSYTGSNVAELEILDPYLNFEGPFSHFSLLVGGNTSNLSFMSHAAKTFQTNGESMVVSQAYMPVGGNLQKAYGYAGNTNNSVEQIFEYASRSAHTSTSTNSNTDSPNMTALGCATYVSLSTGENGSATTPFKFMLASQTKSSGSFGYYLSYKTPAALSAARGLYAGGWTGNSGATFYTAIDDVMFSTFTFSRLAAVLTVASMHGYGGRSTTHAYFTGGQISISGNINGNVTNKFSIAASTVSTGTTLSVRQSAHGIGHFTGNSSFFFLMGGTEGTGNGTQPNNHRQYTFSGEAVTVLTASAANYMGGVSATTTEPGHLI